MNEKKKKKEEERHAHTTVRNRFGYPNLKTERKKKIAAKKEEYKGIRLVQRKTIKKS